MFHQLLYHLYQIYFYYYQRKGLSLAPAVPSTVPDNKLSSSGVAEIVVVEGAPKGIKVPTSAKLIVLSAVGFTTLKVVS